MPRVISTSAGPLCRPLGTMSVPVLITLCVSVLMLSPGSSGSSREQHSAARGHLSPEIQRQCPVLYLLNVEPYPYHDSPVPVWDRGLDVIPAGHLAAEQINNRTDILAGFDLKLIDIESEACGIDTISKGTANVYEELVSGNPCIVGVIGLFCSPVTSVISPIISHPKIGGFVHVAASTSPIHRGCDTSTTNLFHIIGSSSVFNEATIALMKAFDWQRISLVYNSIQLYRSTTAADFTNRIQSDPDRELVTHVPLADSRTNIFNAINGEEARVSYWTVTYTQAAHLLCEAYKKHFLWPGYVYILHEPKIKKILETKTLCSKHELMSALEGVFLLKYRLFVDDDVKLVSGLSYGEFRRHYADELQAFAEITGENLQECVYANSLYDQVWAFAQALNKTLFSQALPNVHVSTESHMMSRSIGQVLSSRLKHELRKVSFEGASGRTIHFGEEQESPSFVNIFQVQNGSEVLIGTYDPFSQNITFTKNAPTYTPSDTFETVRILLPKWLGVCFLVAQGLLFALIATNFILVVVWRKEREIKATSPILSMLIMIGCYLLFVRALVLIVYKMIDIKDTHLLHSLCMLKTWLSVGTDLIFATVLVRLLRIYRIFCTAPMTTMSNYWVDKYLLLYVIFLCLGKMALLLLWSGLDPIRPVMKQKYIHGQDNELPHYETSLHCSCNSVVLWMLGSMLYSGLLILMVVHLAIQTRHVKRSIYKDTKKVNIFIFLAVICLTTTLPLWVVFLGKRIEVGAATAEWLSLYSIPVLCQSCLFVPKTLPVIIRKLKSRLRNANNCCYASMYPFVCLSFRCSSNMEPKI